MSTTGTWIIPTRSMETGLANLGGWRRAVSQRLTEFRRWAIVARTLDEQTAARLAHLERRLLSERLTVVFAGERSRGKSELINAMFFADLGVRLLPSGAGRSTRCPVEILWDPARPPGLRLLPIGTRASPKALREFIADPEGWEEIALDPARPETLAPACEALAETREATREEALALGLAADSEARIEIPRWRYAVINLPHPVLDEGLIILDTPALESVAEPDITVHRLPDAAAIVFVLDADSGVTPGDREAWNAHIAPIDGLERSCFVVLNKIDALRDGSRPESQILAALDQQLRSAAESLRVPPSRVFTLSARQGLAAKIHDERDGLIRSRLYRLEQAVAREIVRERRQDHVAAVRAESRLAFAESRSLLESRLAFARQQLEEIAAIQGKNQKLVESLARKAAAERGRLEQARATMMGLRAAHARLAEKLAALLDPAATREAGLLARARVVHSAFSRQIPEALDQFFHQCRARMHEAIEVIAEARALMEMARRKFTEEYRVAHVELAEFATERFMLELDRLEEFCARDFKATASLLTRGRSSLGALFFDSVALKAVHAFEIADRETRAWMGAFIRPLETQLNDFQEQANTRIEGMGRIRNAEGDLLSHLDELQALAAEVAGQLEECEEHRRKVTALLDEA